MIAVDAMLLRDLVNVLDGTVTDHEIDDLETWLTCLAVIEGAYSQLDVVRKQLTKRLAEQMPDKRVTVPGTGTFVKHGKKDRTKWDKDDLLRAVLDSRLPPDEKTGAFPDESPLDKVLHVFNLPAPRLTALKARGFTDEHIDEFCHSEWGGWSIVLETT